MDITNAAKVVVNTGSYTNLNQGVILNEVTGSIDLYDNTRLVGDLTNNRNIILSLVREVHHASNGSAGAQSIADMVSAKGVPLSRWRASKIMKELNIVSCQQPDHRYKKATKERVDIPNHLDRQFAVTEPNQTWCGQTLGLSGGCSGLIFPQANRLGDVAFSGLRSDRKSINDGLGSQGETG